MFSLSDGQAYIRCFLVSTDPLVIPVSPEADEVLVPNVAHCPALRSIVREGELYLASLPDFQEVVREISNRLGT